MSYFETTYLAIVFDDYTKKVKAMVSKTVKNWDKRIEILGAIKKEGNYRVENNIVLSS